MERFEFPVDFEVPLEHVLAAFWDPTTWPEIAPHVRGIEMHHADADVQVLTMTVETRGCIDRFKTVRIRLEHAIFYFQPVPPPILRAHHGWWRFAATPRGTTVTSEHVVEVDPARVAERLGPAVTVAEVVSLIRNNSLQTMRALQRRLETAAGVVQTEAVHHVA